MKQFMDKDFLLSNATACSLYHNVAERLPIIDYHCHLSPKEIWEDKRYANLTELWLSGDHYKWRLMRWMGTPERLCTGDGEDYEKFLAYAKSIEFAIGNPLYHWTHLELQRYFGIYETLSEKTAPAIWEKANALIAQPEFSARSLIKRSNVTVICTTDDPADSLEYHRQLKEDESFQTRVLPTFRPDNALSIEKESFPEYISALANGKSIETFGQLKAVLSERMDVFQAVGCCVSDHSVPYPPYEVADEQTIDAIFQKRLLGCAITALEEEQYKTALLLWLGEQYARRNWVMQLHLGALRNNNTKLFASIGADVGCDSIDDWRVAAKLSRYMDALNQRDVLPKMVLYTLNPKDNAVLSAMAGNYQEGKGKIQFGSAWWFNDHIDGMTRQMVDLASTGALAAFVGMLTDSRSFTSYPRHEYFRRILCNLLGTWVEEGQFPNDGDVLNKIVTDICYQNANKYFGFEV